jgi:Protein of unknown function (DUF1501)
MRYGRRFTENFTSGRCSPTPEIEPTRQASSPKEKPVHPADLLATMYFALGIDPDMEIRNHLNQPRELVKGTPVVGLWS